ncbi:MAG TPA: oxygenase MpaB family protein [Candidatus Limnocylindrales bacterium]
MTDARQPDPVLGFYGPDSMMWRINREAVLLGAGPAALLLQVAHPLIAEGVAHHSSFEQDPWRRLHGTIRTTMDLVFGDGVVANRAVRRLNSVHAGVRGDVLDDEARRVARAYRALDPALLLWVQATLIVTSVAAYQRWVGPLSAEEREQFWQEARAVGVRLGIPLSLSPADWPSLEAYWAKMLADDGPVHVTPTARRLARLIVRPPFPFVPGPLVDVAALPGLALLPPRIRSEFDITWGAPKAALAETIGTAVRLWTRIVPRRLRSMPQALAADRRARRATISGHP